MTATGRVSSAWRWLTVSSLVLCLFMLVPLAHASPPDPTWIGGLYDDGDHDDVVLAITSSVATTQGPTVTCGEPVVLVIEVLAADAKSTAVAALIAVPQMRAPPSA